MTEVRVVGECRKNSRERIRALLREWNGRQLADLRVFYQRDGVWVPGPKGLCVQTSMLPQLRDLVAALEVATAEIGSTQARGPRARRPILANGMANRVTLPIRQRSGIRGGR